jgi:phosphoribosylpyrophosphate synthetase
MKNSNPEFRKLVRETLIKEHSFLIEGIDIDLPKKLVSFNNNHENNVDTSTLINPTYSDINGISVISIFKRKVSEKSNLDGNPLIYALKGINGWKFKNTTQDITGLLKQFIYITQQIKVKYDTIITIPSTNELNKNFLYRLNKIIKSDFQIDDYLSKMNSDDVFENYIDWNKIKSDGELNYNIAEKDLNKFFFKMKNENNNYFSYKFIKDVNLRKYITKTMYSDDEKTIEYAPHINNKNILILDDTISSGASISEACRIITNTFVPNSVTVITLFSKL